MKKIFVKRIKKKNILKNVIKDWSLTGKERSWNIKKGEIKEIILPTFKKDSIFSLRGQVIKTHNSYKHVNASITLSAWLSKRKITISSSLFSPILALK